MPILNLQTAAFYFALIVWAVVEAWLISFYRSNKKTKKQLTEQPEAIKVSVKWFYKYIPTTSSIALVCCFFVIAFFSLGPVAAFQRYFYTQNNYIAFSVDNSGELFLGYILGGLVTLTIWLIGRLCIQIFFKKYDQFLNSRERFHHQMKRYILSGKRTPKLFLKEDLLCILEFGIILWSLLLLAILFFNTYTIIRTDGIVVGDDIVGAKKIQWTEVKQAELYSSQYTICRGRGGCSGPYFAPHLEFETKKGNYEAWGGLGIGSPTFLEVNEIITTIKEHHIPILVDGISSSDENLLLRSYTPEQYNGVHRIFDYAEATSKAQ